jgi:hypothetical protein
VLDVLPVEQEVIPVDAATLEDTHSSPSLDVLVFVQPVVFPRPLPASLFLARVFALEGVLAVLSAKL